jgi:hypothetical protein
MGVAPFTPSVNVPITGQANTFANSFINYPGLSVDSNGVHVCFLITKGFELCF